MESCHQLGGYRLGVKSLRVLGVKCCKVVASGFLNCFLFDSLTLFCSQRAKSSQRGGSDLVVLHHKAVVSLSRMRALFDICVYHLQLNALVLLSQSSDNSYALHF